MFKSLERLLKRALLATLRLIVGSRTIPTPLPASFQRILVVRQHNQLGDMLCAVPLLRALRSRFPSSHIALIASPVNYDVMQNLRYLDELICFDKLQFTKSGISGVQRLLGFIKELRRTRFDLAIVPSTVSTSFTSDLLAYLAGAPVRIGIGSIDDRENPSGLLYNVPVHVKWSASPRRHQTLRNLDVGSPLSLSTEDLGHEMTLTSSEVDEAKSWFDSRINHFGSAIAIHPSAGKVSNRWPMDRFAELAAELSKEFNLKLFVTCGPMDVQVVDALVCTLNVPVEVIQNQSIRRVASYLGQMDLVISNDTGIMHVAAAVGTPVLSLFGPTDAAQWAPIGAKNRYIVGKDGRMDSITLEEVHEQARSMMRDAMRSETARHGKPC